MPATTQPSGVTFLAQYASNDGNDDQDLFAAHAMRSADIIQVAANEKNSVYAKLAGVQSITGAKTFTGGVTLTTVGLTLTDVNVALSATTGTKIGTATSQKLGFFNATPIVQGTAFTQTDSTATHTHSAVTAVVNTVGNLGGTANGAMELVGATNGGDVSGAIQNNFQELFVVSNALVVDLRNVKSVLNALIDDHQALGLVA